MKKLTKKALPVIICLLLVVSAISGAFGISAETVVNDKPLNLDFSDGLNHWTNTDKVKVKDGAFTFEEGREAWEYLKSEDFRIPDLAVGDKVSFSIKITITDTAAAATGAMHASARVCFDTFNPDGSQINTDIYGETFNTNANGVFAHDETAEVTVSIERTVVDVNQLFNIKIAKGGGTPGAYTFSDIHVINASNITDEENPIYGTEAEGFKQTTVNNLKPLDKALNLDFQQGFRCWSTADYNKYATEYAELVTEGTNKYAKLKGTKQYRTLVSPVIKISNVQVGDKVTVVYDWKGAAATSNFQIALTQWDLKESYKSGGSEIYPRLAQGGANQATPLTLSSTPAGWSTVASATNSTLKTPANGDSNFYVQIGVEAMVAEEIDFCFDNLRIAKVSADGKIYTDVVTNQVIYDANTATTTPGGSTTGGSTTGGSTTTKPGTTGAGATTGTSTTTGDSILMLAALFFVSGAGVFGTAKALKSR